MHVHYCIRRIPTKKQYWDDNEHHREGVTTISFSSSSSLAVTVTVGVVFRRDHHETPSDPHYPIQFGFSIMKETERTSRHHGWSSIDGRSLPCAYRRLSLSEP